jgi:single-strand DNA-binding protein
MQKTLLIGYLGKDPEMKYTAGGTAIATFTIASTERWKNSAGEPQEHTEWFNIKAFGKRAEVLAGHLHKGSRVFARASRRPYLLFGPESASYST